MDYIADFSKLLSSHAFAFESIKCARQFLQLATEKHLVFEYVLAKIDRSGDARE